MEKAKILSASLLDILFEGRNKSYGAYQLRLTYAKRLWLALLITLVTIIAIGVATSFIKRPKKELPLVMNLTTLNLEEIEQPKKVEPPKTKPIVDIKQAAPKVQTIKMATPKIVADNKVITPPPTQEDFKYAKIGTINQKGIADASIVLPPSEVDGKGVMNVKKTEEESTDFIKIEKEAEYPGGLSAWKRYLESNLRQEIPAENGASSGTYQAVVKFIVDIDGTLSDVQCIKDPGFGIGAEAVRVVKRSGKWKPAIQNGKAVKAQRVQPVTFLVVIE